MAPPAIPSAVKEALSTLPMDKSVAVRSYIAGLRDMIKDLEAVVPPDVASGHAHMHGHEVCYGDHGHEDHDHSSHDHKDHDHSGHDHKDHDHSGHDHKDHDHKDHDHGHKHDESCTHEHGHGHDHKKEAGRHKERSEESEEAA